MSIDISQFRKLFLEESLENVDQMETGLLSLIEGDDDPDLLNSIFRAAHSIKGGSGSFGFDELSGFTHLLETLLDNARNGKHQIGDHEVQVLLESTDVLRGMLNAVQDDGVFDPDVVQAVREKLESLLESDTAQEAPSKSEESTEAAPVDLKTWLIDFVPDAGFMRSGNDPLRILRELSLLGDMSASVDVAAVPELALLAPENMYLSWHCVLTGAVSHGEIMEVFDWVLDDCELTVVERVASPSGQPCLSGSAATATATATATGVVAGSQRTARPRRPDTSIRVDIEKIDRLINIVGELVITQSMLSQHDDNKDHGRHQTEGKFREGLTDLERNTRELQECVMRIRMQPISVCFDRFPRLIHDLSVSLGKKIELKVSGETTEIDKTVMEKIIDPLVHLVRNSADHGIETPDVRRACGKPEAGTISLRARHKGGSIHIEIEDDGRGLDHEKIFSKAVEKGLIPHDQTMAEQQISDLVFLPGFSTAETVSDVSGRGVGMDVVRKNILSLGGTISLESRPGSGSLINIRLPLTLAIIDGQLVRVGNQVYIVPLVSIVESQQINTDRVSMVTGKAPLYRLRDEYIPVLKMDHMFRISDGDARGDGNLLVIVESEGRRVGLVVDELLGQQQVVVKSLESNYRKLWGIAGATILGDGTVALILDISGLVTKPPSARMRSTESRGSHAA